MKSFVQLIILSMIFGTSQVRGAFELPSAKIQSDVLIALRDEMIRLDGEGLLARKDRSETFVATTDKLSTQALSNLTLHDFFNSFQRLSATYTNLHSRAIFPTEVEAEIPLPHSQKRSVGLFSEVSLETVKLRVFKLDDIQLTGKISKGDEVVAINGRSIESWLNENLLFCKFTLKVQCHRLFEANLLSLNLSWKGNSVLTYTVMHNGKPVDIKLTFHPDKTEINPLMLRCDWEASKRYPGFKLIHQGFSACLFEKEDDPRVALLRIASFQYNRNRDPLNPFESLTQEVAALEKSWVPRSRKYQHLIIDVLSNRGGNLPIPYYQILLHGKFQEQYVQFKKTPEFESARLRDAMFWEDPSHELQFQNLRSTGIWKNLKYDEFTPPVPMFCADPLKPCGETLFEAKKHAFKGFVHVMVNEGCVSSCDGFAWAMAAKLNAKLYGFPQAADSAFARLRIDAIRDPRQAKGFRIEVNPERSPLDANLIVAQSIAVSRATDAQGKIFNGNPLPLEEFVAYQLEDFYPRTVLEKVLTRISINSSQQSRQ